MIRPLRQTRPVSHYCLSPCRFFLSLSLAVFCRSLYLSLSLSTLAGPVLMSPLPRVVWCVLFFVRRLNFLTCHMNLMYNCHARHKHTLTALLYWWRD